MTCRYMADVAAMLTITIIFAVLVAFWGRLGSARVS